MKSESFSVLKPCHYNSKFIIVGIVYEDAGNYETSYRYFKKNYMIQLEVVGPDHVRAVRARKILQEPTYVRIAQRLGEAVPQDPVSAQQREQ